MGDPGMGYWRACVTAFFGNQAATYGNSARPAPVKQDALSVSCRSCRTILVEYCSIFFFQCVKSTNFILKDMTPRGRPHVKIYTTHAGVPSTPFRCLSAPFSGGRAAPPDLSRGRNGQLLPRPSVPFRCSHRDQNPPATPLLKLLKCWHPRLEPEAFIAVV